MINNTNNRFGESKNVERYLLNIGKFILESDNPDVFKIRMWELETLRVKDLPYDHKLIFCDTSKHLINIRSSVERIDEVSFILTIEESSNYMDWSSIETMEEYFETRIEMLQQRQVDVFDLILNEPFYGYGMFSLEYENILEDNSFSSAFRYADKVLETVNKAAYNFNN